MTRLPRDYIDGRQLKILIVDAERVVAEMLSLALTYEGAQTLTAHDGAVALSVARQFHPDLIIVDTRLPDIDGTTLVPRLVEGRPNLPIILLRPGSRSRRDTDRSDWLSKPFSIENALSQVRMMLRNNGSDHPNVRPRRSIGDMVLDEDARSVSRSGDQIVLTPMQFDLLRFFVRNPHRALSTREILGRVWPYDYAGQTSQVRLYVSYLRKRIDDGRTPMIHTLRGTGYLFKPPHAIPPLTGPLRLRA